MGWGLGLGLVGLELGRVILLRSLAVHLVRVRVRVGHRVRVTIRVRIRVRARPRLGLGFLLGLGLGIERELGLGVELGLEALPCTARRAFLYDALSVKGTTAEAPRPVAPGGWMSGKGLT